MTILAFDCSTEFLIVGLKTPDFSIIKEEKSGYQHASLLLPEIKEILEKGKINLKEIDALVVPKGPGSFTGLRIAMATAKGLSMGANLSLYHPNTLDCIAQSISKPPPYSVSLVFGKRNRYYAKLYKEGVPHSDIVDWEAQKIIQQWGSFSPLYCGPHLPQFLEETQHKQPYQETSYIQGIFLQGRKMAEQESPSLMNEEPEYVRLSEAEETLNKKFEKL